MRKGLSMALLVALALSLAAPAALASKSEEPEVVTVQHILIGFKRSVRGKKLDRTRKEARALAMKLFQRAEAGEEFDPLVKEYTNDSHPGIMRLTNEGANRIPGSTQRRNVVVLRYVHQGLQPATGLRILV